MCALVVGIIDMLALIEIIRIKAIKVAINLFFIIEFSFSYFYIIFIICIAAIIYGLVIRVSYMQRKLEYSFEIAVSPIWVVASRLSLLCWLCFLVYRRHMSEEALKHIAF